MIWTLKKGTYRIRQQIVKAAACALKIPEPQLITGAGCLKYLPKLIDSRGIDNVLIVTGKVLMGLGKLDGLFEGLDKCGIKYTVFDEVRPNPTIENIENARKVYIENNCRGIIAFGGGSPMDCAKVAGARVVNENKSVRDMRGLFKVRKQLPPLFAVPTTSGTGSETTIAAVVTDQVSHEKYAIVDPKLVPDVAVLDPELTVGLPPHITASTGMDALTHAVEAYIGMGGTKYTNENAEKAVKIIFNDLEYVYNNGSDIAARDRMASASYYAGIAFTRAYVGYVHAIAHSIGGLYGVPHGLANAIILPYILEYYGETIQNKLARLAVVAGIGQKGEPKEVLSKRFIDKIKSMNENMGIPSKIKEIKKEDIPLIAERALKEANPDYPVPKIMDKGECIAVINKLIVQ